MIRPAKHAKDPEECVAASNADVRQAAGELLRLLTAPQRLAIVVALNDGPRPRQELEDLLGVPRQMADYHLAILRAAAIVQRVRRGREVVYSLTDERVARIVAGAIACVERSP
jgi:DNA-binding transcriptional ArsR family regulator